MAETTHLTQHIESFVDLARSANQQAASLDVIASLVKNDHVTVETLVRELEMYLTTTDHVIRARGILLFGEVLDRLASKPLDDASVHSLILFFTDKLADWRALRGALVGCLALLRRKSSVGMVSETDAKSTAQAYVEAIHVQSLGQYDRKLCFELMECLLKRYPNAVASLGDVFIYGICESIDEEKDPHCLMLAFHILEILPQLFPDPSGPLASFASDIFDILGRYFPIHFTHPKGEDIDVKKDDLSRALMLAFSSTPLFAPYAFPLLLEKLSSSVPSAKVDSLRYLSVCIVKYGAERTATNGVAIWSALKDTLYASHESILSFSPESLEGPGFEENEIATEALGLLQKLIVQNSDLFLDLIVGDEDINVIVNTVITYKGYNDIPSQNKQKLHAVGRILYASAKASTASCNTIFETFFPRLVDSLGVSIRSASGHSSSSGSNVISKRFSHGAFYLCIELLAACKDLIGGFETHASAFTINTRETWCCMLKSFSASLLEAFSSIFTVTDDETHDADIYFGVKGLQMLATCRGGYLLISKSVFENILMTLVSIVTVDYNKTLLWKLALKVLVHIGSFVERFNELEKVPSYIAIVIEKIVSLASTDFGMPFPIKLEAIIDIGRSGPNYMLKIVKGLEEAIHAKLSEVYVHGNLNSADIVAQLLDCYSDKVIPWIQSRGGFEEVPLQFVLNIWSQIENINTFNNEIPTKVLLDVMMKAMKHAVACCLKDGQSIIIQKSFDILSSRTSFTLKEPLQQGGLRITTQELVKSASRDEWILSLFASVIIAVRSETQIPNVRAILSLFTTTLLRGYVPAAQALGSLINKLVKANEMQISSDCTLEEAMDIISNSGLWNFHENYSSEIHGVRSTSLQIQAIVGLSWIGKGLLMRGHEKVRDITMFFLECLQLDGRTVMLPWENSSRNSYVQDSDNSVMKCAADAFQILMMESKDCLNREFHAATRPLYKQRFFSTVMPILLSLLIKSDSTFSRPLLLRAFAHIIINTPLIVVLSDAKKLIPILLDALSTLSNNTQDKDVLYGLLLVLSGILTDKNGHEAVSDCVHVIINCLVGLIDYPHLMLVRETAIQCLVALSGLPYTRIYPVQMQVQRAIAKALDDPKRAVRQEAVRCRHAWESRA